MALPESVSRADAADVDGSAGASGLAEGASQTGRHCPVSEHARRSAQHRRSPVAAAQICSASIRQLHFSPVEADFTARPAALSTPPDYVGQLEFWPRFQRFMR